MLNMILTISIAKRCKKVFFLLLVYTGTCCYAQNETLPNKQEDWYKQGKLLYSKKDFEKAIHAFEQARLIAIRSGDTVGVMNSLSRLGLCYLSTENYTFSKKQYKLTLDLELQHGDSTRIAKAYNNLGISYYYLSDLDSCLMYYLKALNIYRLKRNNALPEFIKNIGLVYQKMGKYENASKYLFESARIFEKEENESEASSVYTIIGNIYNESGYDSLSIHYHSKSLEIRRNLHDNAAIAQSLNNLGNASRGIFGADSALSLYEQALSLITNDENKRLCSALLNNIGEIYLDKGEIEISRSYFNRSLELKKSLNDRYGMTYSIYNLVRISMNEKKVAEAEGFIRKGMPIAKEIGASSLLLKYYGLYAYLLTSEGRFEEATIYYPLYLSLKDSLLSDMKLKTLSEAEVKYRTGKLEKEVSFLRPLEQEIKILNLEKERQYAQLKFQQTVNWGTLVVVLLLLILIILIWRTGRQRKKFNESLALKNEEIQHRVKNNLGVLTALFSVQSRNASDEKIKTIFQQNEHRIMTIQHLNEMLTRQPAPEASAKIYFEGLIDELLFGLSYSKNNCSISIDNLQLDADKMLHVGLLLNELITNAIKHGLDSISNPYLEVVLKHIKGDVVLKVSDNGPGLKDNLKSECDESFGMELIDKLVHRQLEGKLNYQYLEGAVFTIRIPI